MKKLIIAIVIMVWHLPATAQEIEYERTYTMIGDTLALLTWPVSGIHLGWERKTVIDTIYYKRILWGDSLGVKLNSGYVVRSSITTINYPKSEYFQNIIKVVLSNGKEIRIEELIMLSNGAW